MCVVAIYHRVHPRYPVLIAANRDEFYARPASAPHALEGGVIAGLDGERAGTWMGSGRGVVAAITNQRTVTPADPTLRSRGEIVLQTLRQPDQASAEAYLAALDPSCYNPFNLVFGDTSELRIAYGRRDAHMTFASVPHGLHVLPNDVLDSADFPKVARIRALLEPLGDAPSFAELAAALGDHERPPLADPREPRSTHAPFTPELARELGAVCVHTPHYGTRSMTIVALGTDGQVARYLFADGPPCTTPLTTIR